MTWPTHPAADLFPMLPASELRALADDIKANGQHEPAVVFDGQVIDGRNRIAACALAGVEPRVRTLPSCPDPVGFVLSLNLHRRHLDESQRGIVAAKARVLFAEQAKVRMLAGTKAGDPTPNLGEGATKGESAEQAAAMLNVSRGTVEAASKVLKHGVPELVEAVERGHVAVSAAAAVASLPAEEQREVVAGGAVAVREKAKAVRAAKAKPPARHPVLVEIDGAADLAALDRAFNKVAGAGLGEADAITAGDIYRRKSLELRKRAGEVDVDALVKQLTDAVENMAYERNESVMDAIIAAHSSKAITQDQWAALDKAWWEKFNAIRRGMAATEPLQPPAPPQQADLFSQPSALDASSVSHAEWEGLRKWQSGIAERAGAEDAATVGKVMRLIALSRSDNEHEAAIAARKACQLIVDRGLIVGTSQSAIEDAELFEARRARDAEWTALRQELSNRNRGAL